MAHWYGAREHPWLVGGIRWTDAEGRSQGDMRAPPSWMTTPVYASLGWSCIPHMSTFFLRDFLECVGEFDENYVPEATTCGVGPCVNSGETVCNGGVVENACEPLPPLAPDDATCDSIDVFSRAADGTVCTTPLPEMHVDDLLICGSMGAYTYSLATRFNGFEPPTFVYID